MERSSARLRLAVRGAVFSSTAVLTGSIVSVTVRDMGTIWLSPDGFPMAPSQEVWDALSAAERARVVAELPNEVTDAELSPSEGDLHFEAKQRTLDALRGYYARQRCRIYLSAELPMYYPAEPRFAPDLLAVVDVEDSLRDKWVVSAEGKGLDWVMEVHVGGDRKKDAERNVARYARLGIPEYFLYDRARNQLLAHRLPAPGATVYGPIVPQHGRYESRVLGLEIEAAQDRLRFFAGTTMLLESNELIVRLEQMVEQVQQRAEEEARLREEEARRCEEAEREVVRLREELERLKR
jgi:Uma2 family endonuclease